MATFKEWLNMPISQGLKEAANVLVGGIKTAANATANYNKNSQSRPPANPTPTRPQNIGTWETPKPPEELDAMAGAAPKPTYNPNNALTSALGAVQNVGQGVVARRLKHQGGGGGGSIGGYVYTPTYSDYGAYPEFQPYDPYSSKYAQQIQDALGKLLNRDAFTYNYVDDPMYQTYAQQYGMQGRQALQDTMGDYAGMTGGLASSYAVTAGQQAMNNYNTALNNLIPSLQQAAYDKYMGDYEIDMNNLNSLRNLDNDAYTQFATDRNFDLSAYQTNLDKWLADRDYNLNLQSLAQSGLQQAAAQTRQLSAKNQGTPTMSLSDAASLIARRTVNGEDPDEYAEYLAEEYGIDPDELKGYYDNKSKSNTGNLFLR